MIIKEIERDVAISFIEQTHYSKTIPLFTDKFIGGFIDEKLLIVCTLGRSTHLFLTLDKILPQMRYCKDDYREIGKICISNKLRNNSKSASMFLSRLVHYLKSTDNI